MATAMEIPRVEFLDGVARIDGLTLRSADSIELLQKMEPLEVESLIDSLLNTVAKVAEGATTAHLVLEEFKEQMDKRTREEFEGFRREMLQDLEGHAKALLEELRESNQELSEVMEKNSEELERLIEEKIREKLEEILQRIAVREMEEEVIERTTLKGLGFEAEVFELCRKITEDSEEIVDFVGNKQGVLRRKTGDILVRHSLHRAGLAPKTVIECKDKDLSGVSAETVLHEIKEALANREADACLYLIRSAEQMPPCFRPIKIGRNYVIASCDFDLGLLLRIAKLVGGLECRLRVEEPGVDIESARNELRSMISILEEFSEIRRLSQLASQHSLKVSELAGTLKTKIEDSVTRALRSLEENPGKKSKRLNQIPP